MKKLIAMMVLLVPMLATGQGVVKFELMPNGTYQTTDSLDFVIIPFEGKTADEIYNSVMVGISANYNNPDKVIVANNPGKLLKIRAYSDDIARAKPILVFKDQSWEGYYQFEFRFKDGRVRVSAPYIEDDVWFYKKDSSPEKKSFKKIVKGYFKDGELKNGKKSGVEYITAKFNNLLNRILNTSAIEDSNDDW